MIDTTAPRPHWFYSDPDAEETFSAWQSLLWGIFQLLAPSFATLPAWRVARDLSALVGSPIPELPWCLALIVVGALGLWAKRRGALPLRRWVALAAVVVWFGLWLSLVAANWRTTGTPIYLVLWLRYAWIYARLRFAGPR